MVIVWLLFRQSYDPKKVEALSVEEEEDLIREWKPEALTPKLDEKLGREQQLVVENACKSTVRANGAEYVNFISANYLGMVGHPEVEEACRETINKFGVGSCGPRGFYGTIDVHLELEKEYAKMYDVPQSILYSDGIALMSSVIPAFAKRGDLLIADEAVHWGIRTGLDLSRSNVLYYKHNDMEDLERVLQEVQERDRLRTRRKLNRRFIIVEGVYQNTGSVCPLDKVVELKEHYMYRLIVDDSQALGVLGETGRGSCEHWHLPLKDVDIVCATLDATMATVGGVCVAVDQKVIDHQRLSGAGYCFSASAPPYTVTAGIKGLEIMLREPQRVKKMRANACRLREGLAELEGVVFQGAVEDAVPLVHLHLEHSVGSRSADELFWKIVCEKVRREGLLVDVPKFIEADNKSRPPPSLRMCVSCEHTEAQIERLISAVTKAVQETFAL